MQNSKLKPRPFCGSTNLSLTESLDMYMFVNCEICNSAGPSKKTGNEAIEAWNHRTGE